MESAKLVKLALKRDSNATVGQPAPMHLDCPCGVAVPIVGVLQACIGCGTVYYYDGWIQERGR